MRPSKKFIIAHIKSEIGKCTGKIGLDAASASFKNSEWFKTEEYVGVDLSYERIKEGLNKYKRGIGINADIKSIGDFIPKNSVDVVVSTHTLEFLENKEQVEMIKTFTEILNKNGTLIFNKIRTENRKQVQVFLKSNFSEVKRIGYRNAFSRKFEEKHLDEGYYTPKLSSLDRLLYPSLLRIESLTSALDLMNGSDLYICSGKVRGGLKAFELKLDPTSQDLFKYP